MYLVAGKWDSPLSQTTSNSIFTFLRSGKSERLKSIDFLTYCQMSRKFANMLLRTLTNKLG